MANYRIVYRACYEPEAEGARIVSFECKAIRAEQALRAAAGMNPLWRVVGIEPKLRNNTWA